MIAAKIVWLYLCKDMEVSASEFARMCGVSAMAVSKKIKNGTLIRNSGKKLDTDNPVNRRYLERKQKKIKAQLEMQAIENAATDAAGGTPAALPSSLEQEAASQVAGSTVYRAERRPAQELKNQIAASDHKSRMMMDMTIAELLRTFGTMDNIEQFSKIQRDLSAADEREQRTQEKRLLQIPKDFVVQKVFGYVDLLMNQLLDVPESVCDQVIAVALSGGDEARLNVMRILSDNLTKVISGAKDHIIGELNSLKGKYDKQDSSTAAVAEKLAETMEER